VLYVDAVTFGLSAVLVGVAVPRAMQPEREPTDEASYLRDVLTGLAYIRRVALLRTIATANVLTNFIGAPLHTVVLLAYVEQTTGRASDFGLIFAGGAVGLVAGSVVYGAIGHRLPRRAVFVTAFAWFGLPVWLVTLQPPIWTIVSIFVVSGALTAPYNPVQTTVWQERTPSDLRGRVFGSREALALALLPFGYLLGGLLVQQAGVRATLLAIAAAYALATLWLVTRPALREMARPR
jgi:MFS family permease